MNPGEILDNRYEIIERLGAGGMGEVYKAVHTHLGAIRVIKVVHPQISGNIDAADRFLREGRAATRIHHPNVATLHDFSSLPNGAHYMVWEYIEGENLAQRLRSKGVLPPRQAVRLIIQALHGLEAIHRAGIVHRDISPENLMLTHEHDEETIKIIDLGVAKVEDSEVSQTRTGIFVGKLRYAAPEQLGFLPEGEKVDARVDIYATAMVLVELLTGRPPYEAKSPHEYFILHASQAPLKTVELPVDLPGSAPLQEVLEKALARDRNQRYSTAREFAQALEGIERTLTDAHDTATIMTPIGGDRTAHQTTPDTLHRKTAVTGAGMTPPPAPIPAPPTVANTPRPFMAGDAAPTVLTPLPEASFPQQAPKQGSMLPLILVIGAVLLFVGGGVGLVMFWPFGKKPAVAENTTTATATSTAPVTTTQPGKVAEASVTVTTPPEGTTTTAATATIVETQTAPPVTTTTAPPVKTTTREESRPKVDVAEKPPADEEPRDSGTDVDASPRDGFASGWVYVDGGDSDRNDRALAALRRELRGTRQVALRAGGMQMEVVRALRADFPNLEFVPYADVVIRFEGTLERRGRAGLKRRAAEATVSKNGRVIFRYQLPGEDYRVGDSPAESFARVLANAMNED